MNSPRRNTFIKVGGVVVLGTVLTAVVYAQSSEGHNPRPSKDDDPAPLVSKDPVIKNAATMIQDGRNIFRHETYGAADTPTDTR